MACILHDTVFCWFIDSNTCCPLSSHVVSLCERYHIVLDDFLLHHAMFAHVIMSYVLLYFISLYLIPLYHIMLRYTISPKCVIISSCFHASYILPHSTVLVWQLHYYIKNT